MNELIPIPESIDICNSKDYQATIKFRGCDFKMPKITETNDIIRWLDNFNVSCAYPSFIDHIVGIDQNTGEFCNFAEMAIDPSVDLSKKIDELGDSDRAVVLLNLKFTLDIIAERYYDCVNDIKKYANSQYFRKYPAYSDNAIARTVVAYALKDSLKKYGDMDRSYMRVITQLAQLGKLDYFLSDPVLACMHRGIMQSIPDTCQMSAMYPTRNPNKHICEFGYIDIIETSDSAVENLINPFFGKGYFYRMSRHDYRIEKYLPALDNCDRLPSILNRYLRNKFSTGRTSQLLEKTLNAINEMIHVLEYSDKFSLVDVTKDLPEYIQTAALKVMIDG